MNQLAIAGVVLLLSSAGGFAQTMPPAPIPAKSAQNHPGEGSSCKSDIQKYCKGVLPGMGRIVFCLFDNRPHLTPVCHDFVQKYYDIDAKLAAKAHEPLKQFMLEAYARKAQHDMAVKKAAAAKAGTSSVSKPPAPPASQTAPK
jgi:hypothetical protein